MTNRPPHRLPASDVQSGWPQQRPYPLDDASSNRVEIAAQAMAEEHWGVQHMKPWREQDEDFKDDWRKKARTALADADAIPNRVCAHCGGAKDQNGVCVDCNKCDDPLCCKPDATPHSAHPICSRCNKPYDPDDPNCNVSDGCPHATRNRVQGMREAVERASANVESWPEGFKPADATRKSVACGGSSTCWGNDNCTCSNRTEVVFDIIDFCEMDKNWEVKVEYVTEQLKRLGL